MYVHQLPSCAELFSLIYFFYQEKLSHVLISTTVNVLVGAYPTSFSQGYFFYFEVKHLLQLYIYLYIQCIYTHTHIHTQSSLPV